MFIEAYMAFKSSLPHLPNEIHFIYVQCMLFIAPSAARTHISPFTSHRACGCLYYIWSRIFRIATRTALTLSAIHILPTTSTDGRKFSCRRLACRFTTRRHMIRSHAKPSYSHNDFACSNEKGREISLLEWRARSDLGFRVHFRRYIIPLASPDYVYFEDTATLQHMIIAYRSARCDAGKRELIAVS